MQTKMSTRLTFVVAACPLSSIPFHAIDWDNPDEVQIHDDVVALMEKLEYRQDSKRLRLIEQVDEKIGMLLPSVDQEYLA